MLAETTTAPASFSDAGACGYAECQLTVNRNCRELCGRELNDVYAHSGAHELGEG
jgi:hypothetical protein